MVSTCTVTFKEIVEMKTYIITPSNAFTVCTEIWNEWRGNAQEFVRNPVLCTFIMKDGTEASDVPPVVLRECIANYIGYATELGVTADDMRDLEKYLNRMLKALRNYW